MDAQVIELYPGAPSNDLPEPRNDVERAYAAEIARLERENALLQGNFDIIVGMSAKAKAALHPSRQADDLVSSPSGSALVQMVPRERDDQ